MTRLCSYRHTQKKLKAQLVRRSGPKCCWTPCSLGLHLDLAHKFASTATLLPLETRVALETSVLLGNCPLPAFTRAFGCVLSPSWQGAAV